MSGCKRRSGRPTRWSSERARAYRQRLDFPIPARGLKRISPISRRNTAFMTCIWAAFIPMKRRRNIGRTGAGISSSTATWTRRSRFMTSSCSSFPARTILSSQQTSTTAFRRRASTKSGYFTRRAITAFFSAASRVVRRRLTMKPSCAKWSGARRI